MAGIAVEKPDMGNVQAVVPGKSLVEGLGPVMNIILAFGTLPSAHPTLC